MGKLEKENKKRVKKAKIQDIILSTIYAGGLLSVAIMAPKLTKAIAKLEPQFLKNKNKKASFNRSFKRLKDTGMITFKKTDKCNFVQLTPKGEAKLRQIQLRNYKFKKPKKWDGKWRVLTFDIKEERKGTRDKIRITLGRIGFVRLQDSVWVYPYDCEDLITLLKADFKIGKDLIYMIVDSIENDKLLLKNFNLTI